MDGTDGRTHYVDIGKGELTEPTPQGSIVKSEQKDLQPKQVDRTIAEIAEAHNGRYNIDLHLKHDPRASEAFVQTPKHFLSLWDKATPATAALAPEGYRAVG